MSLFWKNMNKWIKNHRREVIFCINSIKTPVFIVQNDTEKFLKTIYN